jgi:hypothetical protein
MRARGRGIGCELAEEKLEVAGQKARCWRRSKLAKGKEKQARNVCSHKSLHQLFEANIYIVMALLWRPRLTPLEPRIVGGTKF